MSMTITTFPRLDHFLNGYMHQNWMFFGDSLQNVVAAFADDTSTDDVRGLQVDFDAFIRAEGNRQEADFPAIFPNSVTPYGWGMTAGQWLTHVAGLAASIAAPDGSPRRQRG